ncbi:MAG: 30S ribosomal protein S18 [candidate division Zixibacteria bacterium]|nr:30S ribosomal protein S18 [candidate division Zixibacteria bacterium]
MFDMRMRRRKICRFCENKISYVDFKDERLLRRFVNERGKIIPRRISGNCARHQRKLTKAVKRARILAIMAFESESYR